MGKEEKGGRKSENGLETMADAESTKDVVVVVVVVVGVVLEMAERGGVKV